MPPAKPDSLLDHALKPDKNRLSAVIPSDHHLGMSRQHRELLLAALSAALAIPSTNSTFQHDSSTKKPLKFLQIQAINPPEKQDQALALEKDSNFGENWRKDRRNAGNWGKSGRGVCVRERERGFRMRVTVLSFLARCLLSLL